MSFKSLEQAVVGLTSDVMGEDCSYTPNGGSTVTISGVYSNAYVEVEGIVSLKPTLRINLSDLSVEPGKGDTVTVDSVDYLVMESREDGFGGSTLILKKA